MKEAYYYPFVVELYRDLSILVHVIFILKDNRSSNWYYNSIGIDYQVVIDVL